MTPEVVAYWSADVAGLIDAWESSAISFATLAGELTDEQWATPSRVPGWSVGDVVAHVASIEAELAGRPDPAHQPNYEALPHAAGSPTGPYTEIGVDLRRTRSRDEVVAELTGLIEPRAAQWRAGSMDPDAPFTGPAGWQLTVAKMLRMRCFDTWVHEQDIRQPLGLPGSEKSPGAWVSAGQVAGALPALWGRNVKAEPGQTLLVEVRGPDDDSVAFTRFTGIGPDGRGIDLPLGEAENADLIVRGQWMELEPAVTGRVDGTEATLTVTGDGDLAARFLRGMNIAP